MARKIFFSFHYKPDNWRAATVRNIGVVEGNAPVSDNKWEEITKGGDKAIQKWIDGQLSGKSCSIVLVGAGTAGRKWIDYEVKNSWNGRKGLLGIYIHNLKNSAGKQSTKGKNPFASFTVSKDKKRLSNIVKAYDPPYTTSKKVYDHIASNLEDWVEEAVSIRENFKPSS